MDFLSSFAISVSKVASRPFLSIYIGHDFYRVTTFPSGGAFFLYLFLSVFFPLFSLFEGFFFGEKGGSGIWSWGTLLLWQLCVTSLNHDLIYNKVMHIIGSGLFFYYSFRSINHSSCQSSFASLFL